MVSIKSRVKQCDKLQPYRGYIPLSTFTKIQYEDGLTLNDRENICAARVARAVEYLTRCVASGDFVSAFSDCLEGARSVDFVRHNSDMPHLLFARNWLKHIRGLDDTSLIYAVKLSGFEIGLADPWDMYNNNIFTKPDVQTISNIRVMVNRALKFLQKFVGEVRFDFTFEPDGYTSTVSKGDGNFLTADTIWDMKCYKPSTRISKSDTLHVLMYWIMGQHSGQEIFSGVTKIGFFNPRMNTSYVLDVSEIPSEVIREVEDKVLCYGA